MSLNNNSKNITNEKSQSNKAFHSINPKQINFLEEKIKNKKIKDFIPKKMRPIEENDNNKLNINAKEFIPTKNRLIKEKKEEKKENEEKIYSLEFLLQFENMEISHETNLLTKEVLDHINSFKNEVKHDQKSTIWKRKDYTKEEKTAEQNKKLLKEHDNKDSDIKELRAIMNILTKDNYEEEKTNILKIIKNDEKLQEKFINILYKKAVMEMPYAELYATLSKFLDKNLPQKSTKSKKSSLFREKLIDKTRKILKETNFDKYVDEKEKEERELKIKKINMGNINFIIQLIKVKMLSKKIISDCFDYIFTKYQNEKDNFLKYVYAETIILLIDKFGVYINNEKKKMENEELEKYIEKIDDYMKKLDEITNDKSLPGKIKYNIINLIEKKKHNYKETKYEKSLRVFSKKELEEELNKEYENEKAEEETAEAEEEYKERYQEEINEKIKNDLIEYKNCVEEEGTSEKFLWKTITLLYDVEFKPFDDIISGYVIASADFIEKESNIKYTMDYIRELIIYYNEKMDEQEKNDLKKRVIALIDLVKDFAFETPKIYDLYAHLIFVLMENNIMEIKDFQNMFTDKTKDDVNILSKVLKNVYEYNKNDEFKEGVKGISFIRKNKGLFEWLF